MIPDIDVDCQIDNQRRQTEQELAVSCQAERIQYRFKVPFNEGDSVPALAAQPAEIVFQIRKGAYPSAQFNEHSPECGRKVVICQTSPAK